MQLKHFAALGQKFQPASTTKAMHKPYGRGRPHQTEQHNDRQRHCANFSAFAFMLHIKCLSELNCVV
jgi:hypothetical protein